MRKKYFLSYVLVFILIYNEDLQHWLKVIRVYTEAITELTFILILASIIFTILLENMSSGTSADFEYFSFCIIRHRWSSILQDIVSW